MSSTKLKLLALVSMLVAHFYDYIPETPLVYGWIGRLAFPLFLFAGVWGFHYTSNRKVYLFRLYIFSIITNIVFTIIESFFNYNTLDNNIFRTYFTMCVFILLIEAYLHNNENFNKYLAYYSIWQLVWIIIIQNFHGSGVLNNFNFLYTLTGSIFNLEGGLVFVILGVSLYFTKHSKLSLSIAYLFFCFSYTTITLTNLIPRLIKFFHDRYNLFGELVDIFFQHIVGISPVSTTGFSIHSLLFNEYQWMMIFALPIMLLYNNKSGKGYKYMFYLFYPLHLIIIYSIGAVSSKLL